jgi:hypothetical protein
MTKWFQGLDQIGTDQTYPISDWNPKDCGPIDIVIDDNGQWFHEQSPIGRPALKALFAKLLWREGTDYFIKTPVEKMRILVKDAPFVATSMRNGPEGLIITTNFQDEVLITKQNPIVLGPEDRGFVAYIDVRFGLEARFSRALCHELADLLIIDNNDPQRLFVPSGSKLIELGTRAQNP